MAEDRNTAKLFQREMLEWQVCEWCEHILPSGAGHVVRTEGVEEHSNSTSGYSLISTG